MTRNVGKVLDPPPLARAGCALSSPLRHEHPPPALTYQPRENVRPRATGGLASLASLASLGVTLITGHCFPRSETCEED